MVRLDRNAIRRSEDCFVDELFGSSRAARRAAAGREFSARLYRRQPRAVGTRSAHVRRAGAVLRQHPLGARRRRARHGAEAGRRRARHLFRPAAAGRGGGAHRSRLQALSRRAEAADCPHPCAVRLSPCWSTAIRCRPRSASATPACGRTSSSATGSAPSATRGADRAGDRPARSRWATPSPTTSPMPAASSPSITGGRARGLHALQIEINRGLYMNERTFQKSGRLRCAGRRSGALHRRLDGDARASLHRPAARRRIERVIASKARKKRPHRLHNAVEV